MVIGTGHKGILILAIKAKKTTLKAIIAISKKTFLCLKIASYSVLYFNSCIMIPL
jgi:hypothetical protein